MAYLKIPKEGQYKFPVSCSRNPKVTLNPDKAARVIQKKRDEMIGKKGV